jgi:hypothetical protein
MRPWILPALIAGTLGAGLVLTADAQSTAAAKRTSATSTASAAAPRTPDGHSVLAGMWTNGTLTPFERPANQASKPFLTDEEAAAVEKQAAERRANPTRRPGDVGSDNEAFVDNSYKVTSTRQTSLVVDPPDGRVVILPAAEKQRDHNLNSVESYESMSPWDRCITRGPGGLFPAGYNNAYQITQTPDYVVITAEMIHEARIIPLTSRPHLPAAVRSWAGDSIGHWDGATLVVDTTNFHDKGWITTHAGSGRLRGTPVSTALHIVERFTRTSATTIIYEATIDDPNVYAKPWTVRVPMTSDDSYQMFEYACHEGNQAIGNILRGARVQESLK